MSSEAGDRVPFQYGGTGAARASALTGSDTESETAISRTVVAVRADSFKPGFRNGLNRGARVAIKLALERESGVSRQRVPHADIIVWCR